MQTFSASTTLRKYVFHLTKPERTCKVGGYSMTDSKVTVVTTFDIWRQCVRKVHILYIEVVLAWGRLAGSPRSTQRLRSDQRWAVPKQFVIEQRPAPKVVAKPAREQCSTGLGARGWAEAWLAPSGLPSWCPLGKGMEFVSRMGCC